MIENYTILFFWHVQLDRVGDPGSKAGGWSVCEVICTSSDWCNLVSCHLTRLGLQYDRRSLCEVWTVAIIASVCHKLLTQEMTGVSFLFLSPSMCCLTDCRRKLVELSPSPFRSCSLTSFVALRFSGHAWRKPKWAAGAQKAFPTTAGKGSLWIQRADCQQRRPSAWGKRRNPEGKQQKERKEQKMVDC